MSDASEQLAIDEDDDAYLLPSGRKNNLVALPARDDDYEIMHPEVWREMVRRFNEYPALQARLAEVEAHNRALIDASGQECGCGYDRPSDVCLGHLPAYRKMQARLAEVEAELRFHVDDAVKAWSAHEAAETRAEAAEAERDEALNQLDDAPYVAKPIYKGRDPALPAVQPAPEVEALVEALRGLRGASHELLAAVQETGALDNILPELFPDSIRRGTRKDVGYKRVDAARNNMRAQITLADAALAAMEKEKAND
jgi:hypothetical protein